MCFFLLLLLAKKQLNSEQVKIVKNTKTPFEHCGVSGRGRERARLKQLPPQPGLVLFHERRKCCMVRQRKDVRYDVIKLKMTSKDNAPAVPRAVRLAMRGCHEDGVEAHEA